MPLTDQERADFATLASGQISDAMEMLGLRRSIVTGLMMLAAPGTKIVGTAVTCRQVPKNADEDREAKLTRHQEVTRKVAGKGDVVVIDNGGRVDVATWGEFHCYACKQNGVAGAVIDGATRDGPDVRASGLPSFVRGLSPVKSQWDLKTASINEPVMLGPVRVDPGDIIFADETAVVVIPVATKSIVLAKANEIRAFEDANRATLVGPG
ncbi:MAG TPA: RraA family protein [Xanthobacteraceae bacterium]|nr:RraA family protein [Xanthobacteraceae bacterium]